MAKAKKRTRTAVSVGGYEYRKARGLVALRCEVTPAVRETVRVAAALAGVSMSRWVAALVEDGSAKAVARAKP